MFKLKKVTALSLSMVMALSLAACSDKPSDKGYGEAKVIEDNEDWTTTEEPGKDEVERFTTVEGDDVLGITFDDASSNSGFVSYTNGGDMDLSVEDGELCADIKKTGNLEHSCQVYYDGFTMAKDCVYTLSFDAHATVPCHMEWRVQINGGDYHAYASEVVGLTEETQKINCEFTMKEASDPAPRLALNIGGFEENGGDPGEHQVYFDNFSLIVTDGSKAEKIEGAPTPIQVKINQIGYLPEDKKTVLVTSETDDKFKIVKADTGETVYIGEYGEPKYDASVYSQVRNGDFSDFKYPGKYKIISRPSGESYEFSIGEDIYDDVYKDVILMLYKQRCGCEVSADIAGDFAHKECHLQKAKVYGDKSGKEYDVSGGWHDAGDYGRYVVSGAKTIEDLFLAYEDFNQDMDDVGIPESGNGVPDLLDEARYELDWMLKMQDEESGGVYHKVTGLVFPEIVLPTEETEDMYLAPISYAATGDFAAVMAKASIIYKDIDKEFADKCLEKSKKAFAFLEANPEMMGFKNPEEIVTGEYPDRVRDDEYLWAATELYLATKDDTYKKAIESKNDATYDISLGWASIGAYALYELAKADDVDETLKNNAKDKILTTTDELLEECKSKPFYMGLGKKYPWGSNMTICNNGMLLLMANKLSPKDEYLEYAQRHRDYIFGVNGTAYCYVTGFGTLSPTHTHHRPSQKLQKTMSGMLVGGPDCNLEDPYSQAVLYNYAAAMSYVDNEQSFSCNEITIYWNSPLIYLMTGLQ